jgi:hypothetical protein
MGKARHMPIDCIPHNKGEAPDRDDWGKLCHLVKYLRKDHARALVLGTNIMGHSCGIFMLRLQCTRTCGATLVEV